MLSVKNIFAGYRGKNVLHGISLDVPRGGIVYLTGPNGCGKTTLLKCIARLIPYQGQIRIHGADILKYPSRDFALRMGLMPQLTDSYFPYTIQETVSLGRYAHRRGLLARLTPEDRAFVDDCIDRVGLLDKKDTPIGELSGGQLQRVYLARLFAQDPEIALLDEPTNHLDLQYQIELLEFITEWASKRDRTIVGVLHDLNLVMRYAKTAVLMEPGHIYAYGPPCETLSRENLTHCYHTDIRAWMTNSYSLWAD